MEDGIIMLKIEFKDGQEPYVVYGTIETVMSEWKRFETDNSGVSCLFVGNGLKCTEASYGGYVVGADFDGTHKCRGYRNLKSALKKLVK